MTKNYQHPSEVIKGLSYKDLKGANVVFVNMPIRETAAPNTTPEGPLLMATNLRDNYGVNASIVDLNGYRIKDNYAKEKNLLNGRYLALYEAYSLLDKHFKVHGEPELVALSGMITTLNWQENLARIIRNFYPNTFLVSGGGLATELREGLFNYIPELDGVAHSEGDDVIIKIVYDAKLKKKGLERALSSGKFKPYYIGEINRRHRFVYEGGRPFDLDALPFGDLELLKKDINGFSVLEYYLGNPNWGKAANNSSAAPFEMQRSTTFVSSRGCPHACDFCYKGAQGGRDYGMRSAENLAEQFRLHKEKYNVDFIGLPDDNFGISRKRIQNLVPLLKEVGIRWGTHIRLDESADIKTVLEDGSVIFESPKRVDLMAEAGCIYAGFGAESASPKILESMKKGGFILKKGFENTKVNGKTYQFPHSMVQGIKNCENAGIHSNCTWIMGYPGETLEDLKQSIAFIKWQEEFYGQKGKANSVNRKMFVATAYPGTAMFSRPDVKEKLSNNFGIKFDSANKPICDENFRRYIKGLEDATKVLVDELGNPLNYSAMDNNTFLKAREYIENDNLEKVIEMQA